MAPLMVKTATCMTNDKISHFGQGVDNLCVCQRTDESMTRATDEYHSEMTSQLVNYRIKMSLSCASLSPNEPALIISFPTTPG